MSSSMCSSTLIATTVDTGSPSSTPRGQVQDPRLDRGPVGEPGGHRGHGLGIDIGDDVSAEPGQLGRELPQTGAHLEHRRTQVGTHLLELEGPVAALVGTRGVLETAPRGLAERPGPRRGVVGHRGASVVAGWSWWAWGRRLKSRSRRKNRSTKTAT